MSFAAKYQVRIESNDNTKPGADKAKRTLGSVGDEAGKAAIKISRIGQSGASLKGLTRVMHGMEKATSKAFGRQSVLETAGKRLSSVTEGLKDVAHASSGMEGAIGGAAAGLGLFAGVAIAAVAGGAKLVQTWIDGASALGRFTAAQGIAAQGLQELQAAGEQKGVDKGTTANTLAGLKQSLFDAQNGRNQQLAAAVAHFGLKINRDDKGEIDVADFTQQLSRQVHGQKNQNAKHLVAGAFGADGIFNLLDQDPAELAKTRAWARGHAGIVSGKGLDTAVSAATEETRLKQRFEHHINAAQEGIATGGHLGEVLGSLGGALDGAAQAFDLAVKGFAPAAEVQKVAAAVTKAASETAKVAIDKFEAIVTEKLPAVIDRGFHNASGAAQRQLSGSRVKAAGGAIERLQRNGLTQMAATGLVAGFIQESGLDPTKVGDNGHAYGIGQWHADRQAAFRKRYGHAIQGSSLNEQLDFAAWETQHGSEQAAGRKLAAARSFGEAGAIASTDYERPFDKEWEAQLRGAIAEALRDALKLQHDVHVQVAGVPAGSRVTASVAGGGSATTVHAFSGDGV